MGANRDVGLFTKTRGDVFKPSERLIDFFVWWIALDESERQTNKNELSV